MRIPLVDSDILIYEIGFSAQKKDLMGQLEVRSWEWTQALFDERIDQICDEARATEPPILFLSNTPYINKLLNKKRKWEGEEATPFLPNFRTNIVQEFKDKDGEVFKTKEYKGNRKSDKPFHFNNLINHILSSYTYYVAENGIETDDAMCIMQYEKYKAGDHSTIICSRDKDLKQCPGWHFGWEASKQPSWGPIFVDDLGTLENVNEGKVHPKTGKMMPLKIRGTGDMFFYYQMLTGDGIDNVTGAMGKGPVFAYNLLRNCTSVGQMYQLVGEVYVKTYGEEYEQKLREMADLLYMVREVNEKGELVKWAPPTPEEVYEYVR